ncbi:hypothetical protein [Microbacterium dextranolyticum]|uniref:Uncharacterized protein n=1 Tax=Microbacterium dextranolyticum TaxID=36806 RepID=A0A9W6HL14_9MICO|nr:hypothetical protein [Microbacterium dextranolyticum]MBM7464142.1 hypothetical protein [Microbacterium dextranolyticum]GLJ95137.1 hypothetical protein GCM10017591_11990 [Microbacterium dextranolyticum]
MSDIQLDTATLSDSRSRVDTAVSTFQGAQRFGDDIADLTGEDRLAGKVRDFAGNWDAHRAALEKQLMFIRDALGAVVDVMTDLDVKLADSLNKNMVDAVIPGGER